MRDRIVDVAIGCLQRRQRFKGYVTHVGERYPLTTPWLCPPASWSWLVGGRLRLRMRRVQYTMRTRLLAMICIIS